MHDTLFTRIAIVMATVVAVAVFFVFRAMARELKKDANAGQNTEAHARLSREVSWLSPFGSWGSASGIGAGSLF
jgi:hypothetical protein